MAVDDSGFAQRLKLAAAATGGSRPQLAHTLASSDLGEGDIQLVGGFTQALDSATVARLARISGATTNFSPTQRSQLDAIGEPHADVDQSGKDSDSRNWLEKALDAVGTAVSNTGEALVDNPVSHAVFAAFNKVSDVVKLPWRMVSSGIDAGNDDEVDARMRAHGYDPGDAWDYVQFMTNQGQELYHDLDPARRAYGDENVDLAIQYFNDPEGFNSRLLKMDPARAQEVQQRMNSQEFKDAADRVDRAHISPGRDIARLVLPEGDAHDAGFFTEGGGAFTALSGTLDAVYTVALDPTLFAGKVATGVRALDHAGHAIAPASRLARYSGQTTLVQLADKATRGYYRRGLRDAADATEIEALLQHGTAAGNRVQSFLDDAAALRNAGTDAERAAAQARLQARHKPLMPFLDEVNGTRVLPDGTIDAAFDRKLIDANGVSWMANAGKPIETLDDFRDYMANTTGLLRLAGGFAARREMILPGRVSLKARLASMRAESRAAKGVAKNDERYVFDHTKPYTIFPHEAEESIQARLDQVGGGAAERGDAIFNELRTGTAQGGGWHPIRKAHVKFEQRARRVSTLLPEVAEVELTAATSVEQVRRFARLYLNKAEADRLTSMYALGDLGARRQVMNGILEQTFHASGLSRSEAGLKEIQKFRADQQALDKRAYALDGADVIKTEAGDRHVAMVPSQLSETVLLPNFKSLQYMATKHAVGGFLTRTGSMRSFLFSDRTDQAMQGVKMGWITTASGGLRNGLDEVGGAIAQGLGGELARGRALFSRVSKESRKASYKDRLRAAKLEGKLAGRIPVALRGASDTINDVVLAEGLGRVLSYGGKIDDDAIKHTKELLADIQAGLVRENITGTYFADDLQRLIGNDGALDLHQNGLMAAQVQFRGDKVRHEFGGYKQVEIDGGQGVDAWVHNLGLYFQDTTSPAHLALQAWKDARNEGEAIQGIVDYLHTPAMRHFLEHAEIFKVNADTGARVVDDATRDAAMRVYAQRLLFQTKKLVTGRGGQVDSELADMLFRGHIPDRKFLKDLPEEFKPEHAFGKVFLPVNPKHAVGQIAQGYTSLLSKAYHKVVTDQVNAISRNPMLTAAYDQARRNTASYEKHLVKSGFSADNAEAIARRIARSHAENLVIRSIDNPQVASQFSVIARNWWAFERAQEDWLRRWGRILRDDPTVIRKAQLALHGAESAGMVEKDDQGKLQFIYPGSGVALNLFNKVSGLFGVQMTSVPFMPDLSSRLTFLNPSLDNPVGFSSTPIVSIPFKLLSATVGEDYPVLAASMDKVLNGELGAGREWYESLLPSPVNRIISGVLRHDPASQYAAAWTQAVANAEAAGQLPGADASPGEIADFQAKLSSQIKNQMFGRAVFGLFAPAAPSVPTNDVVDGNGDSMIPPDWSFHEAGIGMLKDEARQAFNDLPYQEALAWWAKTHPKELIFQQGGAGARTTVGTDGAAAPATVAAAEWMQNNRSFLADPRWGGPGGIGTYFIPQGTPGSPDGSYSPVAYRAQLEQGIREYKSLDEFYNGVVIQRGEAVYYDTKDDYDAAIKRAEASGNRVLARQLEDAWSQEKDLLKKTNPLMAEKFNSFATDGVNRDRSIAQLSELMNSDEGVQVLGDQASGVATLMLAYNQYSAAMAELKGERGTRATAQRAATRNSYESAVKSVTAQFPGLGDLARGVFRTPE